jgi:acetyl-CoA C-acetyltransferase
MSVDPRTPVLVGAGQITHRADGLDDALEPADLMAEAIRRAAADAGLDGIPAPDSLRVVALLSWRYRDPARVVADRLGLTPRETALTTPGGNSPQTLVNTTARQIAAGELDLAILTGAEAWRTRMRARRAGAELVWSKLPEDAQPTVTLGEDLDMAMPAERDRGIVMPVQVYPMFETALRAAAGRSPEEHLVQVSELWARFSGVAAANPFAWTREPLTAEAIRTPSAGNRMIGLPYTKVMNSNNDVDQGAALVLCSAERATALGVPQDRWVFPLAGTDCHEHQYVSNRWSFTETPAIREGSRRALELAGATLDDIGIVDLYSCFPSAVQLGAAAIGLPLDRQLTRTGGLSFAGGPWNNYVMHAIATVVRELRELPATRALVWANGGYVTKLSFGIYGTQPPAAGFRHDHPQAPIDALPSRRLAPPAEAAGPATVEAYTVMPGREGDPETTLAACLVAGGRRAWGTSNDQATAAAFCRGEWVGTTVTLDDEGRLLL